MAKSGPKGPQIKIENWTEFETLCSLHCTTEEIVDFFKKVHGQMSESTLKRRVKAHYKDNFEHVYRRFQSMGKISLRRSMFKAAQSGSATMQQHLSKNWLGYSDKSDHNTTISLKEADSDENKAKQEARVAELTKKIVSLNEPN